MYIMAAGAYALFKIDNGEEHLVSKNLKTCFEGIFNKELFVRTHRSCYVNKSCIKSIEKLTGRKMCIIIYTGEKLPVSLKFVAEFKAKKNLR